MQGFAMWILLPSPGLYGPPQAALSCECLEYFSKFGDRLSKGTKSWLCMIIQYTKDGNNELKSMPILILTMNIKVIVAGTHRVWTSAETELGRYVFGLPAKTGRF